MKSKRGLAWLAILLGTLGLTGVVLAQVSPNFDLSWHLLSGGGGSRSSANYQVDDSLGQWADRSSSSAGYQIEPGFWYGVAAIPTGAPNLGLSKSGPATATAGDLITYTLTVTNSGDAVATGLVITDTLPSGASYVSGGTQVGNVISWTVASLAASGGSTTVQFVVTATQTITNDDYHVSAAGGYSAAGAVPVVTVVSTGVAGDDYEVDDTCGAANTIPTDGTVQTHTFHDEGDEDWVKFDAIAGKTYVIRVDNVGDNVDAVVMLYDACEEAPLASDDNAFGTTVQLEWDCTVSGWYYVKLLQHDPAVYGEDTNYDLLVTGDSEPPSAPRSVRASAADQALIVQWQRSPERDVVGYRVWWGTASGPPYSGGAVVDGADTTYYEITGLTNETLYYVAVQAVDFSGNVNGYSLEIGETPSAGADPHPPSVVIDRPSADPVYTTTQSSLTIGGDCTDASDNLSRVHVHNLANGAEGWDYSLSGGAATFNVESVPLKIGDNQIEVTVYDTINNAGSDSITIHRLSGNGVVVIVGGHNSSFSLQSNIDYATNRAYRVFQSAGFGAEDIRYLSPSPQDADGDGVSDVISTTTPANVHAAIQWAADQVGPGVPFYLYLMDHGGVERFCADGCSASGRISSEDLDGWLDELETNSVCAPNCLINVIIEACHSGSFIDQLDEDGNLDFGKSISRNGRVVIVSTDRTNYAYASAQGAYFSDAFFSAVAESSSLLTSFDQAGAAVEATGTSQTPWLDDNGDGVHDSDDGAFATDRYVATFFGAMLPEITAASVSLSEGSGGWGTVVATVERGDEPVNVVWAAVYKPSFQEPTDTTLDLGVPLIELEADPAQEGVYSADYNGFGEEGVYRVVIYAGDQAGNQAQPRMVRTGEKKVYLPLVLRNLGN